MSRKNFSQAHGRAILPGQMWMHPLGTSTDKPWEAETRVMAVAEGYVLARHKGMTPFVVSVKDMDNWRLAEKRP